MSLETWIVCDFCGTKLLYSDEFDKYTEVDNNRHKCFECQEADEDVRSV